MIPCGTFVQFWRVSRGVRHFFRAEQPMQRSNPLVARQRHQSQLKY